MTFKCGISKIPMTGKLPAKHVKEKYVRFGGAMRDKNGYELNTASVIAALLYGQGDPAQTLQTAFNFGWDADCNAATAGTIVGVMKVVSMDAFAGVGDRGSL